MPIYAYKCDACGFAKDVLQKISDDPLVDCPQCGKPTFSKQLTAAGFQLKGSGWYVTDFRGGNTGAPAAADDKADDKADGKADNKPADKADSAAPAPDASAPAASPAPASTPTSAPVSVAAPAAATGASGTSGPAKS